MCERRLAVVAAAIAAIPWCAASSEIIPHWHVEPISAAAIQENPALADATNVRLLVTLTGTSLFNVAGFDWDQHTYPGARFFNHPAGGDTGPLWIPIYPALAYDTSVSTTNPAQAPSVPGGYLGPGPPNIGFNGDLNVAWGATPNTGPAGGVDLMIMNVTFLNGGPLVLVDVTGEVRSGDAPNVITPLPPMPVPAGAVPEPAVALPLCLIGVALRRSRRVEP